MNFRRVTCFLLLAAIPAFLCAAETRTLLILHTNDLHDHIRAGYDGIGGMAYISGYIKQVAEARKDVLILDAGDVMDKGDMVSFRSKSRLMYEALGQIGYSAVTIGNHDADYGPKYLRQCQTLVPGTALLCLNWRDEEGNAYFPASKVFDVQGIKVAVIGLTRPKQGEFFGEQETGAALEREAERLKPETHLQIALCHVGSLSAKKLSVLAPEVDVFVTGHTHELLKQPIVQKSTGVVIVQAGSYAKYVGRLELAVDLDAKKIVGVKGETVEMRHGTVPCDDTMAAWIQQKEQELCPEASQIVGRCEKPVHSGASAKLSAEALLKKSGADAAFCHTGQIIRSSLPAGAIDVNALFLTGGQRGNIVVNAELTGMQIEHYLQGLMKRGKGMTQWAGFEAEVKRGERGWEVKSSLEASKTYRIVMPELEWNTRFKKAMEGTGELPKPARCDFTFIDALTALANSITQQGLTLDGYLTKIGGSYGGSVDTDDEDDR
ncbi:MAG TPA: metallophosphoesterase [Candidatus Hydrogenedentes bacterium]|nr:metallophosphoesterase [Candidatus Hydrogenedentota bacterium]